MNKSVLSVIAASALLVGCNQSVESVSQKFNELPPAVQKTARAQDPSAEVVGVSQTTANGVDAYEVEFRGEQGKNPKVLVAADGRLLNSDLPKQAGAIEKLLTPTGAVGTPFSSLPVAVQKTIQSQAPNAQIASISRHDENGRVVYEVAFKEQGKNPTIKVADDGTLVQNLQK